MSVENNSTRPRVRRIALAVGFLIVAALAAFVYWFFYMRGLVYSDDARIDGVLVDLSPQVGGNLAELKYKEGDNIKKDELLFSLDKKALQAAVDRAEAEVLSAQAAVEVAEAQYKKAQNGPLPEEIRIASAANRRTIAQENLARDNLERITALHGQEAVSGSSLDDAQTTYKSAREAHRETRGRLKLLKAGTREEDLEATRAGLDLARAKLEAARSALKQAQVSLGFADVYAPFDGIVVRRWLDPGSTVAPGRPVLTVLDPSTLFVSANIEEKDLDAIKVGDMVKVYIDAYPGLKLTGHVEKILLATNSQFSIIPAEGVSGTYIKVSQRVPIRIALESIPDAPLGPGLSVEVRIHIGSAARPVKKTTSG